MCEVPLGHQVQNLRKAYHPKKEQYSYFEVTIAIILPPRYQTTVFCLHLFAST